MSASMVVAEGFIVAATDYRDRDRLYTFIDSERGQLRLIARGVRGGKKGVAGSLQPFAKLRLECRPGRGEMMTISGARILQTWPKVIMRSRAYLQASAIASLLRAASQPEQSSEELVDFFTDVLAKLDESPLTLIEFAKVFFRFLDFVGVAPQFERCVISGMTPPVGRSALFDASVGGIVARAHAHGGWILSASGREALVAIQRGQDPVESNAAEIRRVLEEITAYQFGAKTAENMRLAL